MWACTPTTATPLLHFGGGTDSGTAGLASRFKPPYDGSMWTAGFTLYF